jgi:thiopeptide-type bacteriocin biosynthesis protein
MRLLLYGESQIPIWHQAFLLVDDMINAFISVTEERSKFTLQLANSYRREFGFETGAFTKQLNDKYRSLRPQIEALMKRNGTSLTLYDTLGKRKQELSVIAVKICEALSNQDTTTRDNLLGSYVHMSMNRLFRSKNRMNELVVYDCLNRHYDSLMAREKYKND